MLRRAAQRWNVSATLLAAQIYAESNFNPFARSRAGAQGIAQFMPATARAYGLANPFDPEQAIDAQAHLMRDLLRQFGSVPLALAAYNAGPGRVSSRLRLHPAVPGDARLRRAILGLMCGAGGRSRPGRRRARGAAHPMRTFIGPEQLPVPDAAARVAATHGWLISQPEQKQQSFPKESDYQKFLRTSGQSETNILQRVLLDLLSNGIRDRIVAPATGLGDRADDRRLHRQDRPDRVSPRATRSYGSC